MTELMVAPFTEITNTRGGTGVDGEEKNELSMGDGEFGMPVHIGRWIHGV